MFLITLLKFLKLIVTFSYRNKTAKLFSSLGGFMGMYVGFSFLSLFEVFEVLGRRLWFLLTRKKPRFKVVAKSIAEVIKATNISRKNVANRTKRFN